MDDLRRKMEEWRVERDKVERILASLE